MPDYIFNTTVLSNFAAANRVQLLEQRYRDSAFTTIEISDELYKGTRAGYTYLDLALQQITRFNSQGWLRILTPESTLEHRLRLELGNRLDAGEASCLALAVSRDLIFATDDRAARRLATERGVEVTGTLGILLALVHQETLPLSEANAMLKAMIQRRYRSPIDRLDDLI